MPNTVKIFESGETLHAADLNAMVDALLQAKPTMNIRDGFINLSHPLMVLEDSEFVLMRYSKRNRKKDDDGAHIHPKKGWCVAMGCSPRDAERFVFDKEGTNYEDLRDFFDEYQINIGGDTLKDLIGPKRAWGIALRIPNPNYHGRVTSSRNEIYNGEPESYWSDVLRLSVRYDDNDLWGIGLC